MPAGISLVEWWLMNETTTGIILGLPFLIVISFVAALFAKIFHVEKTKKYTTLQLAIAFFMGFSVLWIAIALLL